MEKFLQKKNIIGVAFCAVILVIIASLVKLGLSPVIKFEKITSDSTTSIKLSKIDPVEIDDTLLVPARAVFENAGALVDWDEATQSVKLTVEVGDVDTPIKQKCADLLGLYESVVEEEVEKNAVIVYVPIDSCNIVVMYNFKDSDGNNINVEKTYSSNVSAKLDENDTAYVPFRTVAEHLGMSVEWHSSGSMRVFIEDGAAKTVMASLESQPTHTPSDTLSKTSAIRKPEIVSVPKNGYSVGDYIGKFKITHYCTCATCNGHWGSRTAYGGSIRPGVTIAIDPSVIRKMSWVYIDGYGLRLAEDVGGAIRGYHIDMAVPDHATAMAMGVTYRDVWAAEAPGE